MVGYRAALTGFTAGLAIDLLGADPLGASALVGTSAAFFASKYLNPEKKLPIIHLTFRAFLIIVPIEIFLTNLRFVGMDYIALDLILGKSLPVAAYTVLIYSILQILPFGRTSFDGGSR